MIRSLFNKYCPSAVKKQLQFITKRLKLVSMGQLDRNTPLSTKFGYDRGGPVDRVYIEKFLADNSNDIRGKVLEIADNSYTIKFGGEKVSSSEILHVNNENPKATIVGDLTTLPHEYDGQFNCIILTQTLHLIYDYKEALKTCRRLLAQGGVLLLTVPGITNIDHDEWGKLFFYSFTTHSMERLAQEIFTGDRAEIKAFGNVKTATAFLYGLGWDEISSSSYTTQDPHYQVIITFKIVKG